MSGTPFFNMAKRKKKEYVKMRAHLEQVQKDQARNLIYISRTGCNIEAGNTNGLVRIMLVRVGLAKLELVRRRRTVESMPNIDAAGRRSTKLCKANTANFPGKPKTLLVRDFSLF